MPPVDMIPQIKTLGSAEVVEFVPKYCKLATVRNCGTTDCVDKDIELITVPVPIETLPVRLLPVVVVPTKLIPVVLLEAVSIVRETTLIVFVEIAVAEVNALTAVPANEFELSSTSLIAKFAMFDTMFVDAVLMLEYMDDVPTPTD